jgi:ATP/maltotriose-dependent transcriptional regulator MalT
MSVTTDPAEDTAAPTAPTASAPSDDPAPTSAPPAAVAPAKPTCPVLIGRDAELEQLRKVSGRPPALVVIEGEAGIGKSRLISDWLAEPQMSGVARLVGHCTALREPFPFGPVIDALAGAARWLPAPTTLSPVTGALRPLLPELSDRLAPPLERLGNPRQERHRMFRAVRDLLAAIGPAVLVLEDLHEVDTGTRELLRFLIDRLPEQLILVLTYRREDLADPNAPLVGAAPSGVAQLRLALGPLGRAEVAHLAASANLGGGEAPAADLFDLTAGIPLAVEEALSTRHQQPTDPVPPALTASSGAQLVRVPAALHDALLERITRLSRSARQLLHAAAILESPASEELLGRVADVPSTQTTAGLAELMARALLSVGPDGRYRFRNPLSRRAVHDSLAEPTRRQLHRRAIAALRDSSPPPLAELTRHCRAAGMVADWHRYAEAAADQAIALGDDLAASQLLRDVVSRPDASRDTRVRLAIKLGRAALTGMSHGEALDVLRTTLSEPGLPPEVRGELRLCLGVLLRNQASSARQGRTELERALKELPDPRELPHAAAPATRAMTSLGAPYLLDGGHLEQHLEWLAKAEATARRSGQADLEASVRASRAAALVVIGDPHGWSVAGPLPDPDDPVADGDEERRRGRLVANLAWAATCVGHYRQAGSLLHTGDRMSAVAAGSYLACCLTGTALLRDHAVGNWSGLADRAADVVRTMSEVPTVVGEARLVCGQLALSTGELRQAETHLCQAGGSVPVAVASAAGLARLAAATGDIDTASHWVRHGLDLVCGKGVWCWAAELIPTAVAVLGRSVGQQPTARKVLDEFVDGISGRDSPLAEAAAVAGRAMLAEIDGEHLAAAAQHADAAKAYGLLPRPYEAAHATEAKGRCLLAAGRDGATAVLEAMAAYERLGASRDVARCRHLLRSLGRELPHRRGRRGYGSQLSPRERDVVRLIRTGLTNREIAETLFLSPRTVEAHVARALRKLGLPSRRALVHRGADPAGESGGSPRR